MRGLTSSALARAGFCAAARCFGTPRQWDPFFTAFAFPSSPAEEQTWIATDRYLTAACDQRGGRIAEHMSTANVARDLDLLRHAVGDEKLTYAGYSYGSYLGVNYANLFPGKVRALVIDGVLDPIAWSTGTGDQARTVPFSARLGSDASAQATLREFFLLCDASGPRCALSGDAAARFAALAARLSARSGQRHAARRLDRAGRRFAADAGRAAGERRPGSSVPARARRGAARTRRPAPGRPARGRLAAEAAGVTWARALLSSYGHRSGDAPAEAYLSLRPRVPEQVWLALGGSSGYSVNSATTAIDGLEPCQAEERVRRFIAPPRSVPGYRSDAPRPRRRPSDQTSPHAHRRHGLSRAAALVVAAEYLDARSV